MYQLISSLNGFVREEIIPNPFGFVSDNELIVMLFTYFIGATILHKISFAMCGVFYDRGEAAVLGSIGYMFFFVINTYIIIKISQWFDGLLVIGIIYFILVIAIFILLNKIKDVICIE